MCLVVKRDRVIITTPVFGHHDEATGLDLGVGGYPLCLGTRPSDTWEEV